MLVAKKFQKKPRFRAFLLALLIIFLLPLLCCGAYFCLNYYQALSLTREANNLVRVDKFDQAIEKYALAGAKLLPSGLRLEIDKSLEQARQLQEERENYALGNKYFNEEKLESAKEVFEKVSETSEYYDDAQEKLRTIEEKIEEEEKARVVKGAAVSTATPLAQEPTSTPESPEYLRQICENEMNIYKNTLESKLVQASAKNPDYQRIAQTPLKLALDAEIKRRVEIAGYEFFNDCLAGNKRLKDVTY